MRIKNGMSAAAIVMKMVGELRKSAGVRTRYISARVVANSSAVSIPSEVECVSATDPS